MANTIKMPKVKLDVVGMLGNCRQYWLNYSRFAPTEGPISVYQTGVPHPQLNGVIRMSEPDADAISDTVSRLSGVPSVWWIGADSYPGASQDVVNAGGQLIAKLPVMAVRIRELRLREGISSDFTIERMEDGRDLFSWVQCYSEPMGIAEEDFAAMVFAEQNRTDAPGQLIRFAARSRGKIVGTSELFVHEGVAGIYLVTTNKNYRRIGVASALTQAACLAGLEMGLDVATLQASRSGYPVYKKLGFSEVAHYDVVTFPRLLT